MSDATHELLLIGHIVAVFGVRGQIKMRAITDRPDHIETHVKELYLGEEHIPYPLLAMHEHKPGLLVITLEGITSREEAELLRNMEVFIDLRDAAPLEQDEYYLHELYDLRVETVQGEALGYVREVLETGANDVLVVARPDQGDVLIPMIYDVVQELDIKGGRVIIRPLEGLL